jgi:hypothetical protein
MGLVLVVSLTMALALFAPGVRGLLARVEAFRIMDVAVEGTRYLNAAEVLDVAGVPEGANLWDDFAPIESRLRAHPGIATVRFARRIPGRLVVRVVEREPVALVPNPTLVPLDEEGLFLPIDPVTHRLDLPLVHPRRRSRSGSGTELPAAPFVLPDLVDHDRGQGRVELPVVPGRVLEVVHERAEADELVALLAVEAARGRAGGEEVDHQADEAHDEQDAEQRDR